MEQISVIVPIYGVEKYVGKCLYSILNQTYSNLEILAVNDASKDFSKKNIFDIATTDAFADFVSEEIGDDNSSIQVSLEICTESEKMYAYLKMYTAVAMEKYFTVLDNFAQEVLFNRKRIEEEQYFVIDQCLNIVTAEKFAIDNVYDAICIEVRQKSYAIFSQLTRIKYIEHYQNEGLFQARLTGYEYSKGTYITTVDSDDYIGIDFLRLLVKRSTETDADVVVAEMVRENLKIKYKGKRTHAMCAIRDLNLCGEAIADNLFDSEGELSPLWFVWGKLYKKALWDKCYKDLLSVEGHHIMLEDMMYGIIFSLNARQYVYCDADTYFYVVNDSASTTNNGSKEKLYKNLSDVFYAFKFIEKYLINRGVYKKYNTKLERFKEKWARTWYQIQGEYALTESERTDVLDQLKDLTSNGVLEMPDERDVFFYNTNTPWDDRIEMLKEKIVKKDVISFDIFDTLVLRPFYKPSDLFILLNDAYKQRTSSSGIAFSEMRIVAEKQARNNLKAFGTQFEDITIDEIYGQMMQTYGITADVAQYMLNMETKLEIQFCQPRKKIKELYELAKALDKRVVFVSDMYLPKGTIVSILENCGYKFEDNLYLSSELRVSKTTGHLFQRMLQAENIEAEKCIHIGDNWESDGETARKVGIEPWRTPKTIDLFMNNVADIKKKKSRGNYGELLYKNLTGNFMRYSQALDYYGIRCMLAVIANKIFDNPYGDWEPDTDFNRNPYNVGYMALGMHDYGIARWLIQNVSANNKIFFVARDGYLAMKVYEVLKKREKDAPDCEYFYMSRKSFLPLSIVETDDWWTIKENINYVGKTPKQILEYYKPIIPEHSESAYEDIFKQYGILFDEPLTEQEHYVNFVRAIQLELHEQYLIDAYRDQMRKRLSRIFSPDDVMFDVGYSGRAQAILSRLLGYSINAYYIHILNEKSCLYAKDNNFKVTTFFDYSPALTGKIRELVQSEPIPSCVGYTFEKDEIQPVFENKEWRFHEKYVIEQMHRGAVDFVCDFMDQFSGYIDRMTFRKTDISFMHEKFILLPRKADMEIFWLFHFEDDLFFNKDYEQKWLVDIWNGDLKWNNLPSYVFKRKQPAKQPTNATVQLQGIPPVAVSKPKQEHKYVPYRLTPDVPKGLWKKIKYFKGNDHIILKKYMFSKGKAIYRSFNAIYNATATMKHKFKKQNEVGNQIADYTLSDEGNILYNATSAYGLLCCIVHKLTFHLNEPADLMISSWRKDKLEAITKSGFFEKIFIWSDMKYRDVSYAMDKVFQDATELDKLEQEYRFFGIYEKLIPFSVSDYKYIVIAGNTMPFGDFLERNHVPYSIIEDGAGLYSDYSLLQHSIDCTYPLIEQYMIKKYKNLQGGDWCKEIFINCAAQKQSYDDSRTTDFAPVGLIEKLSNVQKKKIFQIYGVNEANEENCNSACLLLTYPLAQREKFSIKEEKMCYTLLADIFGNDCDEIHLKAHPDDRTDFSEIQGLTIVNKNVLSELLWYEKKTIYKKAYATVSTSMNNLLCVEQGTAFDSTFCKEYKFLVRYYVAVLLVSLEVKKTHDPLSISGINVYDEMIKALMKQYIPDCSYVEGDEQEMAECLIAKSTDAIDSDALSKKRIILLNRPTNTEDFRRIIVRKHTFRNYDFVDLNMEELYISNNFKLDLPLTIDMKITGIQIQICDDVFRKESSEIK